MLSKEKIKYYASLKQKKLRHQERKFLIEGFHLIEECLNSSFDLECIIIDEKFDDRKINDFKLGNIPLYKVKSNLFKKLADTENSQGITGVVNFKEPDFSFENKADCLVAALDRITDPGNLGTIIRTAYWFNVDAVILSEDSVDMYNSKVVRATQGGIFHVNIIPNKNMNIYLDDLRNKGFEVNLFTIDGNKSLDTFNPKNKTILVFGNESEGISKDLIKKDFEQIKINAYSNCESLNVAVSCGIALNHVRKIS